VLYLFHREYYFRTPQPSYCKADYARVVVRASQDGGRTFGSSSIVVGPVEGTPYECAIVDGAAFYDRDTKSWLYLGQCLARDEVWNMCLFSLTGSVSPMAGRFTPMANNPVVRSGELWSRICSTTRPSHCDPAGMGSEGTPDIVLKDAAGFYYVTFHGWDPQQDKSARGVAKTADFVHWITNGEHLPGDAIFTSTDCDPWRIQWASGGCVGGGEGSILLAGDFMYELIEAPDISLGCLTTPGEQNWVLGLLRAPAGEFLPTGMWQGLGSNPFVVPVQKIGCYIQYHRLFWFNGTMHLSYWADGWLQIFEVSVPGPFPSLPIVAGPPP
jgi:hypothetical protein